MKGIVSFDYDMTLLDHGNYKIPDSAMAALERLRERYYIVLATGRDLDTRFSAGIREVVRPDGVIHLNGTKITVGDELIYEHRMDPALVRRLLDFSKGKEFALGITSGDEDYFVNPEYVVRHDVTRWGESDRNFKDPEKLYSMYVRTLVYIGHEDGVRLVEEAFPEVKLPMFSSREGADVIEVEASKAEGLKRLCTYWNVPVSETVAFGDSMNDYEIVRDAGIGVAMGNSIPELKKVADYVTTDIGQDGIWNACVNLQLFGEEKSGGRSMADGKTV